MDTVALEGPGHHTSGTCFGLRVNPLSRPALFLQGDTIRHYKRSACIPHASIRLAPGPIAYPTGETRSPNSIMAMLCAHTPTRPRRRTLIRPVVRVATIPNHLTPSALYAYVKRLSFLHTYGQSRFLRSIINNSDSNSV